MRLTLFPLILALTLSPFLAFAQTELVLPRAGITPESTFYFADRLSEAFRQFFTLNQEGKARLQIVFAAERVAEIKIMLETKGVETKGLDIAQSRLRAHVADAATIIAAEKADGKDVAALAKELGDGLNGPKSALSEAFKSEKRALQAKEKELKIKTREAQAVGDATRVTALLKTLDEVRAQRELLELKEEAAEEALEREEERIEEAMEAKEEAEKAIREAEEEQQDVFEEALEEGVAVSAEAFAQFDSLLAQAKSALTAGNFTEAKQLSKQAAKSLDVVEETIEALEETREAKEQEEESRKKQEGAADGTEGEREDSDDE